ncbi:hypothetical protein [uncultured Mucilaginibacter sp.]|uniref:hypothetical protein n=1 Tax=uncultured Mucilaginibacter sp. TaxID=797541 RepID=UPI0025F6372A|nr:hypothetical protein [uncultured Mucilaginibacter sp.]
MTRNEVTEVKNLVMGDRFYKQNDAKKTVLEIAEGEAKVTKYQTYKVFAKIPGAKYADPMKSSTMVVFLRHSHQIICSQNTQ